MAALPAVQHNPTIRAFYRRLFVQGKHKKVALTAYTRKMLIILNAMILDGAYWYDNRCCQMTEISLLCIIVACYLPLSLVSTERCSQGAFEQICPRKPAYVACHKFD